MMISMLTHTHHSHSSSEPLSRSCVDPLIIEGSWQARLGRWQAGLGAGCGVGLGLGLPLRLGFQAGLGLGLGLLVVIGAAAVVDVV